MRSVLTGIAIIVLVLCGGLAGPLPCVALDAKPFLDIKMTPDIGNVVAPPGTLRADALEVADVLKIRPLVERLKSAGQPSAATLPRPLLHAKLVCLWKIMTASQEVRKLVATIDRDLAVSYVALDSLTSRRDATQNMMNTVNFIQGGVLGVVKQSLALDKLFKPGQYLLMTSAGGGTVLSSLNLVMPRLWSRGIASPPNILAHVLDPKFRPADADRSYLWHYMSSRIPGSPWDLTRRDILLRHWHDFEGLDAKNESLKKHLAVLPDGEAHMRENIRLLVRRIDLLQDFKTHIEEFDGALYELHKAMSTY